MASTVIQDASNPTPTRPRPKGIDPLGTNPLGIDPLGRRAGAAALRTLGCACLLAATLTSCASLSVKNDTATSGTFRSTGRSFTFLSWNMPRSAIQIAHENASDAGLPNIVATSVRETDWGWFDWLLEIIGTRSASVRGTWGFKGE